MREYRRNYKLNFTAKNEGRAIASRKKREDWEEDKCMF